MISLITFALNIHLNLGQKFSFNTSQVIFSLEKLSSESLSNKQMDHVQISFPSNINLNQSISIRVCFDCFFQIIIFNFLCLVDDGSTCSESECNPYKFF